MYQDNVTLSQNDILEKEFNIDARGYRMKEVDQFLDIIIKDYDSLFKIVKRLEKEKLELIDENTELKKEYRNLKDSLEALKSSPKEITNIDIIRRLSQLEKIIYGKLEE